MDNDLITPEMTRRVNPGLTDFGSGTILALSGQCLRSAKAPSDCRICIKACPVNALKAEASMRPSVTTECLKCGYCVGICPLNSIAATTRTIQQLVRTLLQATLRVDQLTICCQRSLAMLRLEAESSKPEDALARLQIVQDAQKSDNLFVVPCLSMLSAELWFTALNEIGQARIKQLTVWLPDGQCSLCPANAKDQTDAAFSRAIDTAEQWTGLTVQLVTEPEDIPQFQPASVRDYLTSMEETDRRGMFTGFVDELKRSWDEATRTGNRAADETLKAKARKDTLRRTLLADELRTQASGMNKQVVAPFRQALVEAIGRNPANAPRVRLQASESDIALCDGCGSCVDCCPVKSRRLEEGKAFSEALYCLGCGACVKACPRQACSLYTVSGEAFLRPDWETR